MEHQLSAEWWDKKYEYCRGLMRQEQLESCLVVNGGKTFNKRETKALRKHFTTVDLVQDQSLVNLIPSKSYDLILVNWALKDLSEKDIRQLLFNLRKQLTFRRKLKKENGVIMIKEPVQTLNFEVPIQPFRLQQELSMLVSHQFRVHH
jgi:hypothetical protein